MTAGSLIFTTVLALVPLAVVALSLFTAFPSFERLRLALQEWLAGNLIPAGIAQSVLENLTAFAGKASQLGAAGLAGLVFTSLSLMLTIDHALGGIWRVPRPRPLGQRLLVYQNIKNFSQKMQWNISSHTMITISRKLMYRVVIPLLRKMLPLMIKLNRCVFQLPSRS